MRSLIVAALMVAGCFSPSYKNGDLRCEPITHNCPDGYHCASNNRCYTSGPQSGSDMNGVGGVDLAGVDALPSAPDLIAPLKSAGAACNSDGECGSTHCSDGVCCNSACTGQCEACDTNALGTCVAVQGQPHGSRNACGGSAVAANTCAGICDGATRTTCVYPPSTQICGAACNSMCDGKGVCPGGGGSCPNGFACGTGACKSSCSNDNDCQAFFKCMAPSCVRLPESDCLDGMDNNGDGKIDCDDPTCAAQVSCVAGPGAQGNEIGLMNQASCAATGYSTARTERQGIMPATCSGCSCTTSLICVASIDLFQAASCGGTAINYGFYSYGVADTSSQYCEPVVANKQFVSYQLHAQTVSSSSCTPKGPATVADPGWTAQTTFCATPRSSTNNCGGDATKICVPKPASGKTLCVKVPGATGTCPSGYAGSSSVWYGDFNKPPCGACGGCGNVQASCSGLAGVALYAGTAPNADCDLAGGYGITNTGSGCQTDFTTLQGSATLPGMFTGLGSSGVGGAQSISCDPPSVTTTPATATLPSVICCP